LLPDLTNNCLGESFPRWCSVPLGRTNKMGSSTADYLKFPKLKNRLLLRTCCFGCDARDHGRS